MSTFAILRVNPDTYRDIRGRIAKLGPDYAHMVHAPSAVMDRGETVVLDGIAVEADPLTASATMALAQALTKRGLPPVSMEETVTQAALRYVSGLPEKAQVGEARRETLAATLELIAKDGFPGPRDLDVAIDAILSIFGAEHGDGSD